MARDVPDLDEVRCVLSACVPRAPLRTLEIGDEFDLLAPAWRAHVRDARQLNRRAYDRFGAEDWNQFLADPQFSPEMLRARIRWPR